MIAYAETSAVLAWLLGEPDGAAVREALGNADRVVASPLTGVEAARALARGVATSRLGVAEELAARGLLAAAERSWVTLALEGRVMDRARGRFPEEPVRTLDALHLATALEFHQALGGVTVISLDERVRRNARGLGMAVSPPAGGG